jgi:hypothetical protein
LCGNDTSNTLSADSCTGIGISNPLPVLADVLIKVGMLVPKYDHSEAPVVVLVPDEVPEPVTLIDFRTAGPPLVLVYTVVSDVGILLLINDLDVGISSCLLDY